MLIELAPMEGITVYPFRMTHQNLYSGVDRYFLPFVEAHQTKALKKKEMKDLLPEHNPQGRSVPQLMAKHADLALFYIGLLREYGFTEVNFNFGCPSGTVTAKRKGAGALEDPDEMDRFFDELFSGLDRAGLKTGSFAGQQMADDPVLLPENDFRKGRECNNRLLLSVKTRIGMVDTSRAEELIAVYNRYPFSEIIVHPRLGKDAYKGTVNLEVFDRFYEDLKHPVSYNGDLRAAEDVRAITERYPRLHAVMIGRGLLADPALGERIRTISAQPAPLEDPRLPHFLTELERAWMDDLHDSVSVLYRLKEYWSYLSWNFEDSRKVQKKIMKTRNMDEYHDAVRQLLL